jgi:hypothetical protein
VSDSEQAGDSADSDRAGASTKLVVSAVPDSAKADAAALDEAQKPTAAEIAWRKATLSAHVGQMSGMDTVDSCRMRLLALRTRIEINWPQAGGLLLNRSQGLDRAATADITALLVALPTPLPLQAGGVPQPIILETDTDMRQVAGRAVDAGLALLEGATLETIYPGHVKMLEDYRPDALEPIIVGNLSVGLLVATIIGTLEAVSETLLDAPPRGAKVGPTSQGATVKSDRVKGAPRPHTAPPKRGPSVPRI